jgi:hypothetical protein
MLQKLFLASMLASQDHHHVQVAISLTFRFLLFVASGDRFRRALSIDLKQ